MNETCLNGILRSELLGDGNYLGKTEKHSVNVSELFSKWVKLLKYLPSEMRKPKNS